MATIAQIQKELEQDRSLKLVAKTLSEVSANRLQQIRGTIEKNRSFFQEMAGLYHVVKTEALERKVLDSQSKKGTVSLLLSSNHKFSGEVENQLFFLYISHTPEFATKRLVVGRTGVDFLKRSRYWNDFEGVIFKDDLPTKEELANLSTTITGFERVFVYYPQFRTVMSQQPNFVDLTGSIEPAPAQERRSFYYIFEPEIGKMFEFFDRQVLAILLEQTFLEAELARTAARLISMERAQRNADDVIKIDRRILAQAKRSKGNRDLLAMITTLVSMNRKTVN